jgi:hypothetical protein
MARCADIQELLAKKTVGTISAADEREVAAHLAGCPDCRDHLRSLVEIKKFAAEYNPVEDDPEPDAFDAALHRRLVEAAQRPAAASRPSAGWLRPALAGLFALLIVVAAGIGIARWHGDAAKSEETIISQTEVESKKPFKITMEYDAARPLKNVTVTFALGDGVVFDGAENATQKTWTWTGDFAQGRNEIPFIVNVEKLGRTAIETRADFEGYTHRHRIDLEATAELVRVTYIELPKTRLPNG